jgi:hypothetical protein
LLSGLEFGEDIPIYLDSYGFFHEIAHQDIHAAIRAAKIDEGRATGIEHPFVSQPPYAMDELAEVGRFAVPLASLAPKRAPIIKIGDETQGPQKRIGKHFNPGW